MSDSTVYPVPEEWAKNALIDAETYAEKYRRSIEEPDGFWREEARRLDWIKPFTKVKEASFHGSRTARSTSPPTASTDTLKRAATRPRSSGNPTIRPPRSAPSPIASSTPKSAVSRTCSRPRVSVAAIG